MSMRDNFKKKTISNIARRVSYLCSNPDCRRQTVGPQAGGESSINIGVAAHISAASVGGPRYAPSLSTDERRNESNGIWLCQTCSKLIDSDDRHYTIDLLREWKSTAEERAFVAIASAPDNLARTAKIIVELDETDRTLIKGLGLPKNDDIDIVTSRMLTAAKADVDAFKGVREWPRHSISLNLRTQNSSGVHAVSVAGMAAAIANATDISIVAAPGTGKTTTLVQVADTILCSDAAIAVFVPLAEWSSCTDRIFHSLVRRNAFQGFREQHFSLLAYHGRLVLLLDGWNELDLDSRKRAIHELNALRRDYPLLCMVVSTRRQAQDVPISGPTIEIEALSEEQQLEIARAIRAKDGEALVDRAWRTPGVRELISIPLYLNALLTSAPSGAMPTTKEEVLRLFVTEHESSPGKADMLGRELLGFHRYILVALAVEATRATHTTIGDYKARAVISQAGDRLVAEGQISTRLEPTNVIDVLVSHHMLIRFAANSGVSFQHQQFQEWHASFEVERLMRASAEGDVEADKMLAFDVLDMPAWEESILFTCDRLSRADRAGARAVAAAVLRTLSIDPMLAAEMIYRSAPEVWDLVKRKVDGFVGHWHKPGTVDRAVRFMITTGRAEFASQIWPLVTDPDMQVHLKALRAAHRFRPSVLGPNVQAQIAGLPEQVREHLIAEIASNGDIEGIEFATTLAKADPSTTVQFAVIEALQFRRAHRFVTDILKTASDRVWCLLARKGYADDIPDPESAARLRRERQSCIEGEGNALTKLDLLMEGEAKDLAIAGQIAALIASEDFSVKDSRAPRIMKGAFERYPKETGEALLIRIQAGRDLPYQSEELLKDVAAVDEGAIPKMVIDCARDNLVANTAAVMVGPKTVGILIDGFLALDKKIQEMTRPIDEVTRDEYYRLRDRISISRTEAFLTALLDRSDTKDPHCISVLADLLARHGKGVEKGRLQAEPALIEPIVSVVKIWVEVLLASPQANRHQFVEVVRAIERLPRPEFVERLHRLLEEDLSRWQSARREYFARSARGSMPQDVTMSYTLQYRRAFAAIGNAQVFGLMGEYLANPHFGIDAAYVLHDIWKKQQQASEELWFRFGPDFSTAKIRRKQLEENGYCDTSPHAEAIFAVINWMTRPGSAEPHQRHALRLAKIALSMPHGDKGFVIDALLSLPQPTLEKGDLLESLVLSGYMISTEMVLDGLRELLEASKQKPWLLDEVHNGIENWLALLPFSDRPAAVHEGLALIDMRFRAPWRLRGLLSALDNAPDSQAEKSLEELAENDPRFYAEDAWLKAVVARGTLSSAAMLLGLICDGKLAGNKGEIDHWRLAGDLAGVIREHSEMRSELIRRYECLPAGENRTIIEGAIAELADPECMLALVRGYARDKRPFDGSLHRLVENLALGKKPLADWGANVYSLYGVDVAALRKELHGFLYGGPAELRVAEACLVAIDELRDEHGRVDSEPRHPNIGSGHPWPLAAGVQYDSTPQLAE